MKVILLFIFSIVPFMTLRADSEDIQCFFKQITPSGKCYSKTLMSIEEVEILFVELSANELKEGTYEVEITRIDNHFYKIEGTELVLQMQYCYEYFFWEKVILKVKNHYGKLFGEIIY